MSPQPTSIETGTKGVTCLERTFKSKANGETVTQRLYTCANGLQLAAIRGGAMTLSDGTNWEVSTMTEQGVTIGESVGFIADDQLGRLVALLAGWLDRKAA